MISSSFLPIWSSSLQGCFNFFPFFWWRHLWEIFALCSKLERAVNRLTLYSVYLTQYHLQAYTAAPAFNRLCFYWQVLSCQIFTFIIDLIVKDTDSSKANNTIGNHHSLIMYFFVFYSWFSQFFVETKKARGQFSFYQIGLVLGEHI